MKDFKYRRISSTVLLVYSCILGVGLSLAGTSVFAQKFLQTQEQKINEKIKNLQDITRKDLENMLNSIGTGDYSDELNPPMVAKKDSSANKKLINQKNTKTKKQVNSKSKVSSNQKNQKTSSLSNTLKYAKNTPTVKQKPQKPLTPGEELTRIKTSRSRRLLSDAASWKALEKIDTKKLSTAELSEFLQLKAILLYKAKYYILSSIYAASAIEKAGFDQGGTSKTSWEILYKVSVGKSIQTILSDLTEKMISAKKIPDDKTLPPYFGKSWYYYVGTYYYSKADYDSATKYFSKLSPEDKLYIPASYSLGIIYIVKDNLKNAEKSFQNVLNLKSQKSARAFLLS